MQRPRRVLGDSTRTRDVRRLDQEGPSNSDLPSDTGTIRCPICNENMESLGQLNRHLDDIHVDLSEAVQEVGIRTWFQRQLAKGTKLGPVLTLSKTLKLAEDFERNGDMDHVGIEATQGTDEIVSRLHWQEEFTDDVCNMRACERNLSRFRNKPINCRHCGKLFCEQHTLYQMRLSRSANYEPVRGTWCRVCKNCYEGREWYNDNQGASRNHMEHFLKSRKTVVDRSHLEANRLQKRLVTLLNAIRVHSRTTSGLSLDSFLFFSSRKASEQRAIEQSLVAWEDDKLSFTCPYCKNAFGYDRTKHHCRLCGKTVCGDEIDGCSEKVTFNGSSAIFDRPDLADTSTIQVRLCKLCNSTISQKNISHETGDFLSILLKHYARLQQYRANIQGLMPRFQNLLEALHNANRTPSKAEMLDASRVRKRLLDAFAKFDSIAKRILAEVAGSKTEQALKEAIYKTAMQFLQLHMITLKSVPSLQSSTGPEEAEKITSLETLQDAAEQESLHHEIAMFTEQIVSDLLALASLRLICQFLLKQQLDSAKRRRKFEDLASLQVIPENPRCLEMG